MAARFVAGGILALLYTEIKLKERIIEKIKWNFLSRQSLVMDFNFDLSFDVGNWVEESCGFVVEQIRFVAQKCWTEAKQSRNLSNLNFNF